MELIGKAIRTARKYYDEPTYYHAMRVAAYAADDNLIPDDRKDTCIILAILHDLLEDTEYDIEDDIEEINMGSIFQNCLMLLTKEKESTYEEYLKRIKENYIDYPEAYWVKLADIKDHLCQTETLTDALKEKYIKALPILL